MNKSIICLLCVYMSSPLVDYSSVPEFNEVVARDAKIGEDWVALQSFVLKAENLALYYKAKEQRNEELINSIKTMTESDSVSSLMPLIRSYEARDRLFLDPSTIETYYKKLIESIKTMRESDIASSLMPLVRSYEEMDQMQDALSVELRSNNLIHSAYDLKPVLHLLEEANFSVVMSRGGFCNWSKGDLYVSNGFQQF